VHLQRISLRRFRAFPEADMELPSKGLLLITGANNTGKTALLSALDVAAQNLVPPAVQYAGADETSRASYPFPLKSTGSPRITSEFPVS
jgi:predicted ATP-dependent endonuclease of OLD family